MPALPHLHRDAMLRLRLSGQPPASCFTTHDDWRLIITVFMLLPLVPISPQPQVALSQIQRRYGMDKSRASIGNTIIFVQPLRERWEGRSLAQPSLPRLSIANIKPRTARFGCWPLDAERVAINDRGSQARDERVRDKSLGKENKTVWPYSGQNG